MAPFRQVRTALLWVLGLPFGILAQQPAPKAGKIRRIAEEGGSVMIKRTCTFEHPIVFVFDYSNEAIEIPTYSRERPIVANESCVSIKTISGIDGDVMVELVSAGPEHEADSNVAFNGIIQTPSGRVAVVSSMNEKLLELDVNEKAARVQVVFDDMEFSKHLRIIVVPA
jgi:hypothetical protein